MDLKSKIIIVVLIAFAAVCFFLFFQANSQQQILLKESEVLKTENTTLVNKNNKLENDLKQNQGKIESLKVERDKAAADLKDLSVKFDLLGKSRDELVEKLKKQQNYRQESVVTVQQSAAIPENTDAYWGEILKAKTDLEMQLSSVRVELRNLQASNEALQREKNMLGIDINSLRNEKKDLLRQLDYNQKLLDSMSQEVVREKNDKIAIQDSFKTIKAENNVLGRQLKSLNSRKEILDKKVRDLTENKSTIGKRLNEMETMLNDKITQIGTLKNELDVVKSSSNPEAALVKMEKESVELPEIVVRSSPSTGKEKAEIPVFNGKILAVNAESNFVVIDLGTIAGVKVGDQFNVYRSGKSIGSIIVIQARENISACDIKRISIPLKIGDNIR